MSTDPLPPPLLFIHTHLTTPCPCSALQLMGTLARECAKPQQLRMQGWLYHLLCFAADASANSEWRMTDASLSSLAACLLRGCELPVQLQQRSTLPLLRQLAGRPDAPVRPAIALVVQAMAEGPGVQLSEAEREFWSEVLLQWLQEQRVAGFALDGSPANPQQRPAAVAAEEQGELMQRVTAALEALSAPAGSVGLHVAHAWLAELIVHLSHLVRPYNDIPLPPDAEAAAAEDSGWRWWWPFSSGSTAVTADSSRSSGGGAESAGGGADLPGPAAGAAADSPYLPRAPLPTPAEVAADGSSSWWPGWLPWGGGSSAPGDASSSGAEQKVKTAGKPSDSELALYINAAAIGPVYARSVAAALLEASGRVGELFGGLVQMATALQAAERAGCSLQRRACPAGTSWLLPRLILLAS